MGCPLDGAVIVAGGLTPASRQAGRQAGALSVGGQKYAEGTHLRALPVHLLAVGNLGGLSHGQKITSRVIGEDICLESPPPNAYPRLTR